jgi:hypothetical protein
MCAILDFFGYNSENNYSRIVKAWYFHSSLLKWYLHVIVILSTA